MSDFRNHTCGGCAWVAEYNPNNNIATCRRNTWGDTGSQFGLGIVNTNWPACPAFVPTAPEAETPHDYVVQCKCGSVFRTSQKGCTECADCIEEMYGE